MDSKLKCPGCGNPNLAQLEHKLYRCDRCKMLTDGIDDGDIGHGPPDRRINRQERQAARRARR